MRYLPVLILPPLSSVVVAALVTIVKRQVDDAEPVPTLFFAVTIQVCDPEASAGVVQLVVVTERQMLKIIQFQKILQLDGVSDMRP